MTGSSDKVPGKMLKLIKNDFLASARVIPLFYIIEVASIIAFVIGDKTDNTKVTIAGVVISILVAFLLIFVTLFFVVNDYYKSLFGQQGYLSFTLPVTSRQLLGSKLIVYGLWMVLSYVNFIVVIDFLGKYVESDLIGESTMNTATGFLEMFLGFPSKAQIITYAIYFILTFFALVLSFAIMIYFAIALSHMRAFQKTNVIWAVIFFVVAAAVYFIVISVLEKYVGIYLSLGADKSVGLVLGDPTGEGTQLSLIPHIFMIIQDVAYFILTAHIMHKKVNIK